MDVIQNFCFVMKFLLYYRISKPIKYGIVKSVYLEETTDHPLKPVVVTVRSSRYTNNFVYINNLYIFFYYL